MKNLFFTRTLTAVLLLLCLHTTITAQTPTTTFTVNGLKVILRQTQKETLAMSMYFRGGSANYPAAKAGIESLALSGAVECGNSTYAAADFNDKVDEFGLHLGGQARNDYGVIKLGCISRYADDAWKLFAAAITAPVFDAQKFALLKEQKINDLKTVLSIPDERLENLAQEFAFTGTSYATNPDGSVETLSSLTAAAVKDYYYNTLLNRNRMFLVVAGNISKEDLLNKVTSAFAAVPAKPFETVLPSNNLFTAEGYKIETRPLATNYIAGIINAPALSSPDYPAFRIGVVLLNSGMFEVIRLEKQLSYAPSAALKEGNLPYVTLYASTTQPDETVKAMRMVLMVLQNRIYTDKTINNVRKSIIDSYAKNQELMTDIVEFLGRAEIAGDWTLAERLASRISTVTATDVRNAIVAYSQNIKWAYIGNARQAQNLFR